MALTEQKTEHMGYASFDTCNAATKTLIANGGKTASKIFLQNRSLTHDAWVSFGQNADPLENLGIRIPADSAIAIDVDRMQGIGSQAVYAILSSGATNAVVSLYRI